jgi:hypothetical protein
MHRQQHPGAEDYDRGSLQITNPQHNGGYSNSDSNSPRFSVGSTERVRNLSGVCWDVVGV